jgi:hypothetical protein
MATVEEVEQDAARIAQLVKVFEESNDYESQEKIFELLQRIDRLHRTCVWRIYELTTELGGKGLVDRLARDPIIKTLFVLYDLLPPDETQPKLV